jgi:effector-binding domain-containing protein
MVRGENNYRYYSSDQLSLANVIRTELELGTPLAKIKRMKDRRTPESMDSMLANQIERINEKIQDLAKTKDMVAALRKTINSVSGIDVETITVSHLPEEAIVLGEPNDYSGGKNGYDAVSAFYADMNEKYGDTYMGYPVWGVFQAERILRRDWVFPSRYYLYHPAGEHRRPAADYAVGYARGGYGQADGLYRRLLDYIEKNDYEVCGDAYEEYPLNEICIADYENYLIRVMITVRGKKDRSRKKAGD